MLPFDFYAAEIFPQDRAEIVLARINKRAKGQIFFEGLWVGREIFRAIKLGRVDEDRDGNRALRSHHFASCSNQGEVAPMKRTHRRHQD